MLVSIDVLHGLLARVIADKRAQGHDVDGLDAELAELPRSYDAVAGFAQRLADLPLRADWPYVEPHALDDIRRECDPDRTTGPLGDIDRDEASARVRTGFLGSVAGCILGKPVEMNPTLDELQHALAAVGAWPLDDYVPEAALAHLPRAPSPSWPETVRERITHVAPDDDLNYTILGMLALEEHGLGFETRHVRDLWLEQLPIGTTFGPERTQLLKAGLHTLLEGTGDMTGIADDDLSDPSQIERLTAVLNPREELCGALIRADAYGYACPGRPELAAELAWRDARFTHRRTGVYGAMFVAAAIAAAFVTRDRLEVGRVALQHVPQRSRFAAAVTACLELLEAADGWSDGYRAIHDRFGEHDHCTIYQEVGTLLNTLLHAEDVGHGICLQVSQGNDTDSFGATAGALLGVSLGPDHLDGRWLSPFGDDIRTALAGFHERSLDRLADRIGRLPELTLA